MDESGGYRSASASTPPSTTATPGRRELLHQLNNIFASIHASLDLALAHPQTPEAKRFLLQAQESARTGARLIQELRLRPNPPPSEHTSKNHESHAEPPSPLAPTTPPAKINLEGSERVLVADDDDAIRMLVRAVLSYRGYQVTEAANGEEAIRLFQTNGPFALAILDFRMPKLDGKQVLDRLRALDPSLRSLVLSGLPLDQDGMAQDLADGFDGRLGKPFNNTELLTLVRQVLDRRTSP